MDQQTPKLNIDLKNTEKVITPDGNYVVAEGIILRKASRFAVGTDKDALIPIPVFYDVKTGAMADAFFKSSCDLCRFPWRLLWQQQLLLIPSFSLRVL